MLNPKKIPLRMCVACHEMKPKKELQRIVRLPEGVVSIDPQGKKPGRGAYICPKLECLKKAQKAKALERKFEAEVGKDVYAMLEEQFTKLEQDGVTDA